MTDPEFRALLSEYDVILLQETHLRPGQDRQLALPPGFACLSLARPVTATFTQAGGGLIALTRAHIPVEDVTPPNQYDILALRISGILLLSVYLPPEGSPWLANAGADPIQRFTECLLPLAQAHALPIVVLGDFNARVGCLSTGEPRQSPDGVASTRGRALLRAAATFHLHLLNGTRHQPAPCRDRFTSFQPAGSSVIDLALASHTLVDAAHICVQTLPPIARWSDHAPLVLTYVSQTVREPMPPRPRRTRPPPTESFPSTDARVDVLLQQILPPRETTTTTLEVLYGPANITVGPPQAVCLVCDGADGTSDIPQGARVALYWGTGHRLNTVLALPHATSRSHAHLLATAQVLLLADPTRPLRIWADCDYLHRVLAHWVPSLARAHWDCAHADTLAQLVTLLRAWPASVRLLPLARDPSHPNAWQARQILSREPRQDRTALPLVPPLSWLSLPTPPAPSPPVEEPASAPKVSTPLPPLPVQAEPQVRGDNAPTAYPQLDELTWAASGYESLPLLARRRAFLTQLTHAPSPAAFWATYRRLVDDKPRPSQVSLEALTADFRARMNPPPLLPETFDGLTHALNRLYSRSLPRRTTDYSAGQHFATPFSLEEIEDVKLHLRKHGSQSAVGADQVDYSAVINTPSEKLCELFNACIADCSAPAPWLVAVLAAARKPGKDGSRPENYRTIGLESCFLKTLTVLIDRRLRDWAKAVGRLPDSQSGFRAGHRTYNNAFVVRAAIEKARALGRTLFIVFADLSNAFPSVDQHSLWSKLARWGVGGPLFDWLRMLYSAMQYFVRLNGDTSELFQAAIGILIGDPASPVLWLLYISDFDLEPDPDDVVLHGRRVSHLEQADDIALLCLSARGMQTKLAQFEKYCDTVFVLVNVIKTVAAIHGPLPDPLPPLVLHGVRLRYVPTATYVGTTLTSTHADIFHLHYANKANKARAAANATLSLTSYTGPLPPLLALELYRSHVDPHLTAGCEVALDSRPSALREIEDVQAAFLRRALHISRRAQLAPLHTETGIWPIRYRRFHLALRYLAYLLTDTPPLPLAAFRELWDLSCRTTAPTWWTDLYLVGCALPVPIDVGVRTFPTLESVQSTLQALRSSLAAHLRNAVLNSQRLPLLRHRVLRLAPSPTPAPELKAMCATRDFLHLPRRRQREALCLLVFSEHPLAVERLRRAPAARPIPRAWRVCRFCQVRAAVEDEPHVLLYCPAPLLCARRVRFVAELTTVQPSMPPLLARLAPEAALDVLLSADPTTVLPLVADYIADVFELCSDHPLLLLTTEEQYLVLPQRYLS
ncbi:hypothetical protein BN946_scf184844.g3 [Trametes cinnabarina]|uniref:Reverse transcriptase domain-containing protein n=1 Tax=Pycnoporus cinnabarinus TaxID=5643 RepID=A0A060SFH4_PYCCI|nr:hypothetical protein BN946_scf184844.g3 [Trametes cinnabarina]